MAFAHPCFLLLLLLLPLLAWLKGKRGSPPAFLYSSVKLVEGLTRARRSRAGNFLAALRWLTLAIFIFALAQPRLSKSTTEVKASGIDIVCALDLSGSMISEDFVVNGERVNRVNMAKSVLKDFIDKRPNDRIGLVVFAAQAFIATPLTCLLYTSAFMKFVFPRDKIYVGEPVVARLDLYLRDDVQNFGNFQLTSLPTDGFSAGKAAELQNQRRRAQVGGRVYTIIPLAVPLTAVRTGPLTLGPFTANAVVVLPSGNQDGDPVFRQFFNQGEQQQVCLLYTSRCV